MEYPLEGVKVLDLCRILPGPFCTMLLADMGAEVVKVEEMEDRGGLGRDMLTPPSPNKQEEERSAAYNHLARNKKSIALNLKDERAKQVFYKLVTTSDVIIESYRPGVVKDLGIDYETISGLKPEIIYCSISGYGQDSLYPGLIGHDPDYCSVSGAVSLTGDHEGSPVIIGVPLADVSAGLHATIGILCALRVRDKTGIGQLIDLSSVDCLLSFTGVNIARYFRDGFVPRRGWVTPFRNIWRTKDGKFICATNPESHLWQRFCKGLGREDLIPYQRAKGEKREEVISAIKQTILTKTRDEWLDIMRKSGTSIAPVLEIDEIASEPNLIHRQMLLELDHHTQGKVKQVGMPIKLSKTPGKVRSFAPSLGQHTAEVMQELGYSEVQIQELQQEGVIK